VIGVIGTAAVLSARDHRATLSTPPAAAAQDTPKASEASGADSTTVTLDPDAARNAGLRTEPVAYHAIGDILTVPGTVEVGADHLARVTPPVAGKVTRLLARLGETVRAGQPVALLESYDAAQAQAAVRESDADLQQARAQEQSAQVAVRQAQGRQASAEDALRRQRELARAGAFSQAPLQAARSDSSQAESNLLSAQAEQQRAAAALARSEKLFSAGVVSRAELEGDQTAARQAQIRVDQAQAQVTIAKQALTREQKVFGRDLLTQREIQTAEADVRATRSEVQRAQAEAAAAHTAVIGAQQKTVAARANLSALAGGSSARFGDSGKVIVLSPVNGTVSDLGATLGQAVERTAPLMTIENLQSVVVQASIPEQDVARVRPGQRAEVTVLSYPNAVFTGVVRSLAARIDEKTRTLPIRILVPNERGQLRPEMFAQVRLTTAVSRRALVVSPDALVGDGDEKAVYVAGPKPGDFEKRSVTIGKSHNALIEITSGLKPGDQVVAAGVFVLKSEAAKGELKDSD